MKKILCLIAFFIVSLLFISGSEDKMQDIRILDLNGKTQDIQGTGTLKPDLDFGKLPLYFIYNKGQVNEKAKFYAKASRYTLWMTKEGLVFESSRRKEDPKSEFGNPKQKLSHQPSPISKYERDVSRLFFNNANKDPEIVPIKKAKLKVNYFIGNDRSKWHCDIPTSQGVLYKNLYKDIDLKVYGIEKQIEYDWIVKPGGNPGNIIFEYKNIKGTRIDDEGNLIIETDFGDLMHKKPVSYQVIRREQGARSTGNRKEIDVKFKKINKNTYGFEVNEYDRNHELIIDPVVLAYSTYLGGNDSDTGSGIAVDSSGYAYVTGYTDSTNFPTKDQYMTEPGDPLSDVFVTKIDATGTGSSSLIYSTYLGGNSYDYSEGIAVDSSGNAYVTGRTSSTDFPTKNHYQLDQSNYDVFVTKIDTTETGSSSLIYSTYLGGNDIDYSEGIAVDSSGNTYVAGYTDSTDFPTKNQYLSDQTNTDAFVTKIDTTETGSSCLIYSTYLGGTGTDYGKAIAADSSGNAYVTGYTWSTNFPTKNQYLAEPGDSLSDVFVTKIDTTTAGNSSLIYSTYLGGSSTEEGYGIAVDSSENVYVTGYTNSTDFPTQNQYQSDETVRDAFVTKIDTTISGISSLIYSTYLGGSDDDYGHGIAADSSGNAYVTGYTNSIDFPTKNQYQSEPGDAQTDAFVTKIDTTTSGDPSLIYSTYLGGNDGDYGRSIAVDSSENVYVTGYTDSTDFPTQNQYQSDETLRDAFVTKLILVQSSITVTSPNGGEILTGGTTHNITWTSSLTFDYVDIEYYDGSSWIPIVSGTTDDGSYPWIVPNISTTAAKIWMKGFHLNGNAVDQSDNTFTITYSATPPEISLNRTQLNFGSTTTGTTTTSQTFNINNSGGANLNWSVTDDATWLGCSPLSGTNTGSVTVSVDATGLSAGTYTGTITVSDSNASNTPQTTSVTLNVYGPGATSVPFGSFATPTDGSTVSSSIPVTGWVLDDIGVESVEIYRKDGNNLMKIDDAILVEGARPDVEQAHPDYPCNYKAGWGYMMLTNFLPGGDGTFVISAIATDKEGHQETLGTKIIYVDNTNAVKPFGAIDTPTQGGTASGSNFINWGWVLTPMPNNIPTDGSTISVYVDGVNLGNPTYDLYRIDIANFFPGYENSNGAAGYFYIDTTSYENGIHTIQWVAGDSGSNTDGIGSRYFSIQNTSPDSANKARSHPVNYSIYQIMKFPMDNSVPVKVKSGFNENVGHRIVHSDEKGISRIVLRELERVEIRLSEGVSDIHGYMVSGNQLRPLPIGSTLNARTGTFLWQPGPGFIGEYKFAFVFKDQGGRLARKSITLNIIPKF